MNVVDPWGMSFKTFMQGVGEGVVNLGLGLVQMGMRGTNPALAADPVQYSVNFTDPDRPMVVTSLRDPTEELKAATVVIPVGKMLGRFGGNAYLTAEGWFDETAPQEYLDEVHADLGRDTPGVVLTVAPLPKVVRAARARGRAIGDGVSVSVRRQGTEGGVATARISGTGTGVRAHQVVDRIAAEAQGAFSQANKMLTAGNRSTPWANLYQRVKGSGRWFENLARRNALHQLAERQLLRNRYVLDAQQAGYIVQFNKGSALGLRGSRGGLLRPDIQIGIPGGRWGIVDWTTEGSAAKVFNYSDPRAPYLINVTLP
jgi:hypothetical protein